MGNIKRINMENITEEIVEFMREKLIADGKSGRFFADTHNLVQYMEAEEIIETYQHHYPHNRVVLVEI